MKKTKVAAIQLKTTLADPDANIARCGKLAREALDKGAEWIALPEFFNTGIAWKPEIRDAIETESGRAAGLMRDLSKRNNIVIGGSFLCRIGSGAVVNRYMVFADGNSVGYHDKDLPTMWENAFYEGGAADDTGFIGRHKGVRIGSALCWEFMRTATALRLRGKVDLIMGGSCWWSIPELLPAFIRNPWEKKNAVNSIKCIQETARLTGAPVIHAAHCGEIECPLYGLRPLKYRGHFEGNAAIVDASGNVIARRSGAEGEGIVCADIEIGAVNSNENIPERFWLLPRGPLPAIAWYYQRWFGRRWYSKNVKN